MNKNTQWKKVVSAWQRWLFFSVIIGLLPILFKVFGWMIILGFPIDFAKILGDGDLLLISAILCAMCLGELQELTPTMITRAMSAAYIIIIAISSFIYALVWGEFFLTESQTMKNDIVAKISVWIFFASIITNSIGIYITASKNKTGGD